MNLEWHLHEQPRQKLQSRQTGPVLHGHLELRENGIFPVKRDQVSYERPVHMEIKKRNTRARSSLHTGVVERRMPLYLVRVHLNGNFELLGGMTCYTNVEVLR